MNMLLACSFLPQKWEVQTPYKNRSAQISSSLCGTGQETKLVAVISCTDQRLRPRRTWGSKYWTLQSHLLCFFFAPENTKLTTTDVVSPLRKLYVAVSIGVCLLASALVLFFLFPRAVILSPVEVKSSFVYATKDTVNINITVGRNRAKEKRKNYLMDENTQSFHSLNCSSFVECVEHHQQQLCGGAGLQSDSAGPQL